MNEELGYRLAYPICREDMPELEQARQALHEAAEQLACYEYLCEQKHEEIQKLALELSAIRSQFHEACQKVAQLEMARLRE